MAKAKDDPDSGPIGNTDPGRRGRSIPPGGRKGTGKASGKQEGGKRKPQAGDPGVDGYGIGGRKPR